MSTLVRSKYNNVRTTTDGIKFDSKKESARYLQLKLLERHGSVRNIRLQVPYDCLVAGVKVCRYKADFVYELREKGAWREVVSDVKGYRTQVYMLKKKLVEALFNIKITEE